MYGPKNRYKDVSWVFRIFKRVEKIKLKFQGNLQMKKNILLMNI